MKVNWMKVSVTSFVMSSLLIYSSPTTHQIPP